MDLPALQLRPPEQQDLLGNYAKMVQLKSLLQNQQFQQQMQPMQVQQAQLQTQQQQLAANDQQAASKAMREWNGQDMNQLPGLIMKHGGSAQAVLGTKAQILKYQTDLSQLTKDQLANEKIKNDYFAQSIENVKGLPPEQQPQAFEAAKADAVQKGHLDPQAAQQLQYQGPQMLDMLEKTFMGHAAATEQALKQAQTQQAIARTGAAQAQQQKEQAEAALVGKVPGRDVPYSPEVFAQRKALRANVNLMTQGDAKDIADAIENGEQPPTLTGLYRNAGPVRAELARRGVPIAKMETDWKAVQRSMASMNSTQQLRLRQSIDSASELLDKIDSLYGEWKQLAPVSGFKVANHAALVAMKNLPGRPGAVAQALDTQISELTADLGNIYMGGNSPTDQALKLGAKALSSDWGPDAFEEGIKQAHLNVGIRKNAILHSQPAGVSAGSPYLPQGAQEQAQGGTQHVAGGTAQGLKEGQTGKGSDGRNYIVKGGKWVPQ